MMYQEADMARIQDWKHENWKQRLDQQQQWAKIEALLLEMPKPVVFRGRRVVDTVSTRVPFPIRVKHSASYKSSPDEYIQRLQFRGYTIIGRGHFSTVLAKNDSDRVIKVCRCNSDYWCTFAMWTLDNPHPMNVKIYAFKKHAGFYVAVLERIKCTLSSFGELSHNQHQLSVIWDDDTVRSMLDGQYKIESARWYLAKAVMDYLQNHWPDLLDYCKLLHKDGLMGDMHKNNFGFRADGSVVVFDPAHSGIRWNTKIKYDNVVQFRNGTMKRAA
jgi:hypothetical protein